MQFSRVVTFFPQPFKNGKTNLSSWGLPPLRDSNCMLFSAPTLSSLHQLFDINSSFYVNWSPKTLTSSISLPISPIPLCHSLSPSRAEAEEIFPSTALSLARLSFFTFSFAAGSDRSLQRSFDYLRFLVLWESGRADRYLWLMVKRRV